MKIKGLIDEDIANYKKCSMFIIFPYCTLKCDKENGCNICQNSPLLREPDIEIQATDIIKRYKKNPLTHAVVCGGLEPFDSFLDLFVLVSELRMTQKCNDDIVIYTGYTEEELIEKFDTLYYKLLEYKNIIIKFGRFIPRQKPHYDEILGVNLASDNQFAKEFR